MLFEQLANPCTWQDCITPTIEIIQLERVVNVLFLQTANTLWKCLAVIKKPRWDCFAHDNPLFGCFTFCKAFYRFSAKAKRQQIKTVATRYYAVSKYIFRSEQLDVLCASFPEALKVPTWCLCVHRKQSLGDVPPLFPLIFVWLYLLEQQRSDAGMIPPASTIRAGPSFMRTLPPRWGL